MPKHQQAPSPDVHFRAFCAQLDPEGDLTIAAVKAVHDAISEDTPALCAMNALVLVLGDYIALGPAERRMPMVGLLCRLLMDDVRAGLQ